MQHWERHIQAADELTQLISAYSDGDESAYDDAIALLYDELRHHAHVQLSKPSANVTLQTTALVNEAYVKLKNGAFNPVDRSHFLAIAATAMRQIIIDYAKSRLSAKRGGGARHVALDETNVKIEAEAETLLQINEALTSLHNEHPRLAQVFECKFFAGLDDEETANAAGMSRRTVQRDWLKARAFLQEKLTNLS